MKPSSMLATLFSLALLALPARSQVPTVTSIGPEEYVSTSYMEHPSVATDSRGQPHFVGDFGVGNSFMKFNRVNKKWTGGIFAYGSRGGRYDASRLYIGQIEIDSKDRAWISCKMGVKEYGDMYGQGLWLFGNVAENPYPPELFFRFVCVYKGMGLISTDAKYVDEGVMLGTFGNWEKISAGSQTIGKGTFKLGNGGEKVRFRIASYAPRFTSLAGRNYADGIWHTAMNGYSACPSQYQNSQRFKAGYGPLPWASYGAYPRMSDDYCHPGLGTDLADPRIGYIGSVFGSGLLCINIWDGNRMLFNPSSLKVLDYDAVFGGREGVRFAPVASGGTFVFWAADGNLVKMCYLAKDGSSTAPTIVGTGRSPGVATDRFGNIHLVYYNRGIRYRKIQVSVLQGLEPRSRVTATRTPRFRWTATKAAAYTLEITQDGTKMPLHVVTSNAWRPAADLAVGDYTWRVKEGRPDGSGKWTAALGFEIPPAVPVPETPDTRFPDPVRPSFAWSGADPRANRFQLQLFSRGDLVDALTVTGAVTTARWDSRLGAGEYAWRIKAVRQLAGHAVESGWSAEREFQVAVPGSCAFTAPDRMESFDPGWRTVTCVWTAAEGAASYTVKVLFNGELLLRTENVQKTRLPLAKAFQPGYYSLFVQPVNGYGIGAWSPVRTFIVNRQMTPGGGRTLAGAPRGFEWTRSKEATRYLLRLSLYDKTQQKYVGIKELWVTQPAAGATPRWTPAVDFTSGAYRWAVTDYAGKKGGFTSVDYFQVRVPGAPLPLSPAGAAAGHRQLAFAWEDPSGFAEEYQAQVYQNGDKILDLDWTGASALADPEGYFAKTWSLTDDAGGAYTWRVRGRNGSGSGPWRQTAFTLTPLDMPRMTGPKPHAEGAVGESCPVSWGAVSNAANYEVYVMRGSFTDAHELLSGTNWMWTPAEAGTYSILLRAGETGWSRWTNRVFTVY